MIRNLTIILAIMMSVILIPIDLTFYLSDSGKAYKVTGLALITMSQVQGARIWAHVAMSYVGTGVCLYFSELNRGREMGFGLECRSDDDGRREEIGELKIELNDFFETDVLLFPLSSLHQFGPIIVSCSDSDGPTFDQKSIKRVSTLVL